MQALRCLAAILALILPLHAHSQAPAQPRPSYPAPAYSVTVPFAMPADFAHLDTTLKLLTTVNGGPAHAFTMDTGSVGVVVPADEVPNFDPEAPGNTPGQLRYSSSGLTLEGFWTTATVRFLNPSSMQSMAEATVQVLAVTKGSCQGGGANAGRCTGNIPHMLGVGFGRGYDAANGMGGQARNPFVNLAPMSGGEMRHGYLITPSGITFGLTDPEVRNFQFIKLTPSNNAASGGQAMTALPQTPVISTEAKRSGETPVSAPAHIKGSAAPFTRDYQTAPGFLTLAAHDYPMGTVLIDTGLTNMILEEPGEPGTGDLPPGQQAVVHLLGNQLRYTFTTGAATTSVSPRRATWAKYSHGSFINTGLRALACFDYLYDADNGYLALRPTCAAK